MAKVMPKRCAWVTEDPLYIRYHDKEWGRPVRRDRKLFEFLVLEAAQAGLSWITILKKREFYRAAFAEFDYEKVARFTSKDVERLLKDPGIVRHRLKIESAIHNAARFLEVREEFGSFSSYLWNFVGQDLRLKRPAKRIPAQTELSLRLAQDLKKRGFKFMGPTTTYAFMQAVGLVNDHLTTCEFR